MPNVFSKCLREYAIRGRPNVLFHALCSNQLRAQNLPEKNECFDQKFTSNSSSLKKFKRIKDLRRFAQDVRTWHSSTIDFKSNNKRSINKYIRIRWSGSLKVLWWRDSCIGKFSHKTNDSSLNERIAKFG